MNDNELLLLREMMRTESDRLLQAIQDWTKEHMVSKKGYLEDQLEWTEKIVIPLKTRVNALWTALGLVSALALIIFYFKG